MEDLTVRRPRSPHLSRLSAIAFGLLLVVATCLAAAFFFARSRRVTSDLFGFDKYTPVPPVFIVNESYLLPPAYQLNRGT